jgi:hypothetical protein
VRTIHTQWITREIEYRGPELRPHWILEHFKIPGDALVAFVGPCDVATQHLVDWEDRLAMDHIRARSMIHWIGEFFGADLAGTVAIQRLFVAILKDLLIQMSPKDCGEWSRSGDDLYLTFEGKKRKLSVSIVTASPVSTLLHLGINIDPEGAPVAAIGLAELKIDPVQFAEAALKKMSQEYQEIHWACTKVKPVV